MTSKNLNSPQALNQSYGAPEIVNQRQRTLAALQLQTNEHVLDIGCGTGFLSAMLAEQVGAKGKVIAFDKMEAMVAEVEAKLGHLPQLETAIGDATSLPFDTDQFDAITCTQVLLYVDEVDAAISEMTRVTKPGGRVAILETDWRGAVIGSSLPEISDRIFAAWDQTVPSPNLPRTMKRRMQQAGITDIYTEAIPLLNTEFDLRSFSCSSLDWLSGSAYKAGAITKEESTQWREDIQRLGDNDEYFFCVNRFLFVGTVP